MCHFRSYGLTLILTSQVLGLFPTSFVGQILLRRWSSQFRRPYTPLYRLLL